MGMGVPLLGVHRIFLDSIVCIVSKLTYSSYHHSYLLRFGVRGVKFLGSKYQTSAHVWKARE